MPLYVYSRKDGSDYYVERVFPMNATPETIQDDNGETLYRDLGREICTQGRPAKAGWPMKPCFASGVNANQAQELRDFFKKHSLPTEVNADGNPIYRDANHRKKALKLRGFVDRNSFN